MNKNTLKNIALILLLGITVFSIIRYVSELKTSYRLQEDLTQAQGKISALVQEKQNLLQELGKERKLKEQLALKNANLKDYLRASKNRITRLFQDNSRNANDLEEVNAKFSILKAENQVLIDNRKLIYTENEQFKLKLNSIDELKKTIRELKAKKRKIAISESGGNQGFLIKDGRSTVRIEVIPAKTKE